MAIYHLTANAYSRKDGHSSTAGAAYRAGVCIEDLRTGEKHDYTRRSGVAFSALCLPGNATADRAEFWNQVEAHHKRGDAITCREVEVSLPAELDADARQHLAHTFAKHLADTYGVAADLAIHEPSRGGDERNHHAHILLSACAVSADGTLGRKAEALDPIACKRAKRPTLADTQREHWANMVNAAMEAAGHTARVDHRSLVAQKAAAAERGDFKAAAQLDRLPTRHEGKATTQARRRGERVPRARRNDRRQQANARRLEAHEARFQQAKDEAQAAGRLTPYDEQAAHARALLERTQEGRARLRKAYNPTPTKSPRNGKPQQRGLGAPLTRDSRHRGSHGHSGHAHGLGALPAVRPLDRAATCRRSGGSPGGPGPHPAGPGGLLRPDASRHSGAGGSLQRLRTQRGSVAPRSPAARTRGGLPEGGGKVERLAELRATLAATASMEKAIAAILAGAAQALARPQALTPWQRSTARSVLETHQAQTEALAAIDTAAEKRTQTRARVRLARADANDTSPATGVAAAALRAVGLTPAQDKEAQAMRDALARAKRRHGRAKHAHEDAKQVHQQATTAAEKARADFAGAFGLEVPRFDAKPAPQPSAASSTRPRPFQKLGPTPGSTPVPRPPN
ncbi:MAG: MobA/MobL family protein [Stenotrophomonas sp.]